jgi:trans-aconitate methyltransferase
MGGGQSKKMTPVLTPDTRRTEEYYDTVFKKDLEWYAVDPEHSQYYPIWMKMINFVPKGNRVIDAGCGVGQAIQLMTKHGRRVVLGIDYSPVAIEKAMKRNPDIKFMVRDLMKVNFKYGFDTIFASETFEHLDDDLAFLDRIPSGTQIVFSVPNQKALGHMRYFTDMEDVIHHYSSRMEIKETTWHQLVNYIFFIVNGVKK